MKRLMQKILWNLLLNIGAMAAVLFLLHDVHFGPQATTIIDQLRTLVIAGLLIGALNMLLKPFLIFLSLPAIFLTVGLFLLVINTLIFYFTVQLMPEGTLLVDSTVAYFLSALIFSIVNTVEQILLPFRAPKTHE